MGTASNSIGAVAPISRELLVERLARQAAHRDIVDWCKDASTLVAFVKARAADVGLAPAQFVYMLSSSNWLKDAMDAIACQSDADALWTAQSLQLQAEAEWQKVVDKMKGVKNGESNKLSGPQGCVGQTAIRTRQG